MKVSKVNKDKLFYKKPINIIYMGNFLEEPIKDKLSEDYENEFFEVGVCSMQGWRNHMEDAHIADLNLVKCNNDSIKAIFGVFDGHGGDTVSKFVS